MHDVINSIDWFFLPIYTDDFVWNAYLFILHFTGQYIFLNVDIFVMPLLLYDLVIKLTFNLYTEETNPIFSYFSLEFL